MKKWLVVTLVFSIMGLLLVGGCSALASEDVAKVKSDLNGAQDQVAKLQSDLAKAQSDLAKAQSDLSAVQAQLKGTAKQSDVGAVQDKIKSMESQVASLSAISAYGIWYDQFYLVGNYEFADTPSFNQKLETLVKATNNSDVLTAWNSYIAGDKALSELLKSLPEDANTWNKEQYDEWLKASTDRYNALGEVGTALFNAIVKQ